MPKTSAPESLKLSAQQVLDDLLKKQQIPFKLTAHEVESIGPEEYIVRFHDSRMRSLDVSWRNAESFQDKFRTAVLDRVKRLSGPLDHWRST